MACVVSADAGTAAEVADHLRGPRGGGTSAQRRGARAPPSADDDEEGQRQWREGGHEGGGWASTATRRGREGLERKWADDRDGGRSWE